MTVIWTLLMIVHGTPIATSVNFDSLQECRKVAGIIDRMDKERQLRLSCIVTQVSVVG